MKEKSHKRDVSKAVAPTKGISMSVMNQVVSIGPKFFANELRVYRNWSEAFWRENIQNSFDARADKIDITIADGSTPDTKTVVISDNGDGMNRDILEKVYFTLGETTKDSGNSVGGFGKARILTCFAQKSYTLRTDKLFVTGEGSNYRIEDTESKVRGVRLEIEVFHKNQDLEAALIRYLNFCHLDGCHITINGKRHTEWTYRNKQERRLSFGTIYTNKSRKEAGILVRVGGVHMFKPYTSAPFLVIVEIDRERSREVLQANRDGLLNEYQNELESFINELNINKQSALRQKRSKSIKYEGTGTFTSRRSKDATAEQKADAFEALLAANNIELPSGVRELIVKAKDTDSAIIAAKTIIQNQLGKEIKAPDAIITQGRLHDSGYETAVDRITLNVELFNVIVEDETTNPKVRKVIESYYPHNWDLLGQVGSRYDKRYGERRSFRAGVEKYKLLVLWKAACEYCLRLLQDELQTGSEEIAWGVGWCFTDPTQGNKADAMYKHDDGVNWLMLNPCTSDGTMRLSLSDKRDLIRIISCAAHEVCHIIANDHDEAFANLLNNLLEECMFHQNAIINHMKACKDDAVSRLERLAEAA